MIGAAEKQRVAKMESRNEEGDGSSELTVTSSLHAVHAQPRTLLLDLPRLYGGESLDRGQPGVFGERHGNGIECFSEGAHRVLLQSWTLRMSLANL